MNKKQRNLILFFFFIIIGFVYLALSSVNIPDLYIDGTKVELSSSIKVKDEQFFISLKEIEEVLGVSFESESNYVPISDVETFGYTVVYEEDISSLSILSNDYIYPQDKINIPILMYHNLVPGENNSITVDPDRFKEQLLSLKKAGFTTINDHELLSFLHGELTLPEKPIMITFDDGYLSNYEYAFPILKELNMKATMFVIGVSRGKKPFNYEHFTWKQAREMYETGLIEIQSHTFDLHYQRENSQKKMVGMIAEPVYIKGELETIDEYIERAAQDFKDSKHYIEKNVGNKVVSFSYPYGTYSDLSEQLAKKAGYRLTYTVQRGYTTLEDDGYLLNRFNVDGTQSGEDVVKMIENYSRLEHYFSHIVQKLRSVFTLFAE
ncbi:polysaccharide deacetylase family protein [Bacillus sp. FJAT-45350]|uniref:polysaccharide deacetylase family protein n=1 Tax=Bacillus sp. FJAT-45350 TaxID=2011014 RepID=UPI000BB7541E|nr:polysaccharide deacetylase family protein [Bacillus sp. FJAT-45350]